MGLPAAEGGLGVHWLSAAAAAKMEEVSSSDSDGSMFIHNEFGMCRTITEIDHLGGSRKRSSDQFESAAGNNVAEAARSSSRASDDDENGINTIKKLGLSKEQSTFLEESFKEQNTLNPKQKLALAKQLNLRPRQVEVWFQNRRARLVLLIYVTKVAKSAFDKALAEHEDIDDAVGSEEPTERDHGVDL
ncbi:hypothetical protein OROHE_015059 [Orobanche hederae]